MIAIARKPQSIGSKALQYLNKNVHCLMTNPQLFVMRKTARMEVFRDFVCAVQKTNLDKYNSVDQSLFPNLDVNQAVQDLKAHGCYLGLKLPESLKAELLDFAYNSPCYGDRNPDLPFQYAERAEAEQRYNQKFMLASYLDSQSECPAFQKLVNDSGLLAIAAGYLGADPVFLTSEIAWSFPTSTSMYEQMKAAQVYHYDIDDYRSIKFFFYLTDVTEESGPHVCMLNTHKNKTWKHQIIGQRCASIPDEVLEAMYGQENAMTICGESGFGFVEDTFCFHKGAPPRSQERLLLQMEFTLNHYNKPRSIN